MTRGSKVRRRIAAGIVPALLAVQGSLAAGVPVAGAAAGAPDPDLAARVEAALAEFAARARFPLPPLGARRVGQLVRGEVVRIRDVPEDPERPQRVIGLRIADLPRDQVWVGYRDPHFVLDEEVAERRLGPPGPAERWYGFLDLPWPFADRQWVVDVEDNVALAEASGNRAWERSWTLAADGPRAVAAAVADGGVSGVTPEMAARAIYTPVNHGAWLAISLPGGRSLLGYHVTSVVGGGIPDRLVADFALARLRSVLGGIVARAHRAPGHYGAGHAPVLGGDGRTIPPLLLPASGLR